MLNDIFKIRSCSGCLDAALNVYSTNFNKLFKSTWIWTFLFAIFNGGMVLFFQSARMSKPLVLALTFLVMIAVNVLIDAKVKSAVLVMIDGKDTRLTYLKALRVNSLLATTAIVLVAAISATFIAVSQVTYAHKLSDTTFCTMCLSSTFILLLLYAVLVSPLIYSLTRYMLGTGKRFKHILGIDYKAAIKKLGFLFSLTILVSLICTVVEFILGVPGIITNFASTFDNYGTLYGDKSGLPAYFPWLNLLATMLFAFILQYLSIWVVITFMYGYGSVEAYRENATLAKSL